MLYKNMAKTVSPDRLKFWQERIEQSNGQSLFVPDQFKEEYDRLNAIREEIKEENLKLTAKAARMNNGWQNWWLSIQEYLEKNGVPDVWVKDLGEDESALNEGLAVVNITKSQPR